jgi:hypothetical protein
MVILNAAMGLIWIIFDPRQDFRHVERNENTVMQRQSASCVKSIGPPAKVASAGKYRLTKGQAHCPQQYPKIHLGAQKRSLDFLATEISHIETKFL